jgi:hypothetical protein
MKKFDIGLLHDDEFIEQFILADPYIAAKFRLALAREITAARAPAVLRGGGPQIMTPAHKPKNLAEAAQMTRKYLSK